MTESHVRRERRSSRDCARRGVAALDLLPLRRPTRAVGINPTTASHRRAAAALPPPPPPPPPPSPPPPPPSSSTHHDSVSLAEIAAAAASAFLWSSRDRFTLAHAGNSPSSPPSPSSGRLARALARSRSYPPLIPFPRNWLLPDKRDVPLAALPPPPLGVSRGVFLVSSRSSDPSRCPSGVLLLLFGNVKYCRA